MSKPRPGDPKVDALILKAAREAEQQITALANGLQPGIKNLDQDGMNELRPLIYTIQEKCLKIGQAFDTHISTLNLQAHGGFQKKE